MLFLGVDVGATGAIASIDDTHGEVLDLPITRAAGLLWVDGPELLVLVRHLVAGAHAIAYVEALHATPINGSRTTFLQGSAMGSVMAALQIAGLRIELVTPGAWKKTHGLVKAHKDASLDCARRLFPLVDLERKKHHNRAEALLIAEHGRRAWRPA